MAAAAASLYRLTAGARRVTCKINIPSGALCCWRGGAGQIPNGVRLGDIAKAPGDPPAGIFVTPCKARVVARNASFPPPRVRPLPPAMACCDPSAVSFLCRPTLLPAPIEREVDVRKARLRPPSGQSQHRKPTQRRIKIGGNVGCVPQAASTKLARQIRRAGDSLYRRSSWQIFQFSLRPIGH